MSYTDDEVRNLKRNDIKKMSKEDLLSIRANGQIGLLKPDQLLACNEQFEALGLDMAFSHGVHIKIINGD